MLVIGIDVGTQAAKAVVSNANGLIVAEATHFLDIKPDPGLPQGWVEQDPEAWWAATKLVLRKIVRTIKEKGMKNEHIKAIGVDSTSGTIVPVDKNGHPLRPAIMYIDNRALEESEEANESGKELTDKLGYKFQPSFALPKILWIKKKQPEIFQQTYKFIHPTDYLVGKLTRNFNCSDTSNVLKTGYDLVDKRWPPFIEDKLGISLNLLPEVFSPGQPIGKISANCALDTGLGEGTPVVAGCTDGTAGFIASGTMKTGDWNSNLGTTLVVRGVSSQLIRDEQGRIYCHLHPNGNWLPGGASNTGGECLDVLFGRESLKLYDQYAMTKIPTSLIIYPLMRAGERLPFRNTQAQGFVVGNPYDSYQSYAGYLEGVGLVEKWIYEVLVELGVGSVDRILVTGGGAKSNEWLRVRANILNKVLQRPKVTECAFGSAILAASQSLYQDIDQANQEMVKMDVEILPDKWLVDIYDKKYFDFREECKTRGYV